MHKANIPMTARPILVPIAHFSAARNSLASSLAVCIWLLLCLSLSSINAPSCEADGVIEALAGVCASELGGGLLGLSSFAIAHPSPLRESIALHAKPWYVFSESGFLPKFPVDDKAVSQDLDLRRKTVRLRTSL